MTTANDGSDHRIWGLLLVFFVASILLSAGYFWFAPQQGDVERPNLEAVEPLVRPEPRDQDFVGSAVCADCHEEIAKRYQTHAMAHSLATVASATPLENYDAPPTIRKGPARYSVTRQVDKPIHHERMLDDEGVIFDISMPVSFALGSGTRGRSYLAEREGALLQSPIGWYSGSKGWDLSPGYEEQALPSFDRHIDKSCLYCHVGRMAEDFKRTGESRFFEASIGCERCHGPGGQHVKAAQTLSTVGDKADLRIPSLATLNSEQRESLCTQCHLLGDSIVLRYGRTQFDFRPGDLLHDIFVVFTHSNRDTDDSGQAISQVEQLHASRCFLGSSGNLTCLTCHDPHGSPAAAARDDWYNSRCLKCHDKHGCSLAEARRVAAPAMGSCIHCHMPRKQSQDVPHTAAIDHTILRQPRAEQSTGLVKRSDNDALDMMSRIGSWKAFRDAESRMSERESSRSRGLAYVKPAEDSGSAILAVRAEALLDPLNLYPARTFAEIVRAVGDDVEVLHALGAVYALTDRTEMALAAWSHVLELDPKHQGALLRLATHFHDNDAYLEARSYLERALEVRPDVPDLHARYAHVLAQFDEWPQAFEEAELCLQWNPVDLKVRAWLIESYERRKMMEKAEAHRDVLRRILEATKPK